MQLNIKKPVGVINETQQTNEEEINSEGAEESRKIGNDPIKEKAKVRLREMDYVEKILLQNQKALNQTLTDMQNQHTKKLNEMLQNNGALTQRIMAMEMQMHSIQVRLGRLSNGAATTQVIENTGS